MSGLAKWSLTWSTSDLDCPFNVDFLPRAAINVVFRPLTGKKRSGEWTGERLIDLRGLNHSIQRFQVRRRSRGGKVTRDAARRFSVLSCFVDVPSAASTFSSVEESVSSALSFWLLSSYRVTRWSIVHSAAVNGDSAWKNWKGSDNN